MSAPQQPPTESLVYEAIGLKKSYDGGRVGALRGISLSIKQGEFVAIVGPSGCGKSTLLQMLGSLDTPGEGVLNYRGKPLPTTADAAEYRSQEIGFVFQSFQLLPTFNVLENVQIPMFEGKLSRAQRQERAAKLLESVGLGHRLKHYPSELSGGERQRVAIARGLANQPSVVLADEPTGNLDSASAKQIMELLLQLHRGLGMTLILVTHDPTVAQLADRTIRLKDGLVIPDDASAPSTLSA
jgi:ABC-type lipoprotein export system ATPase subunit